MLVKIEDKKSLLIDELFEEVLRKGSNVKIRLSGGSMHPFLRHGRQVEIQPVGTCDIQIGDVAIYTMDNGLIAHRVIKKMIVDDTSCFVCKGDASSRMEKVSGDKVLGKIVAVCRENSVVPLNRFRNRFWNRFIATLSLWSTKSYLLAYYYWFLRKIYSFLYNKKWLKSSDVI